MKRTFVLFPFFMTLLGLWLVGCQPGTDASEGDGAGSDSLWSRYLERYDSDELGTAEKLAANGELLRGSAGLPDTARSVLFQHRAALFRRENQLDSALRYLNENLTLTQALGDTTRIADAHYRLGFYYRLAEEPSRSLEHNYQAVEQYKALGDSIQVGRKSLNLANLLNALGNYSEAETIAVEGLEYIENSPQIMGSPEIRNYVAGLYNALAIATKELRNYPEALAWYEKSLALQPGREARLNIRHNVAVVLTHMDSLQAARALSRELAGDSLLNDPENARLRARIIDQLGHIQGRLNLPGAEENLQTALNIRQELAYTQGVLSSYLHLGEFYRERSPARAREMAQAAYHIARELENPNDRLTSLALLIDVVPNPAGYARAYTRLSDSLQQVRRQTKDQFAKVRYESEKNLRNYLIARREASENSLQLERSQNRNLLLLSFVGLLLISGLFIYRYLRLRHRKREIQAVYATESRISKKVHDELANDIFNLLNAAVAFPRKNREELQDFVNRLDQLYQKSREISRDSAEIPTGPKFKTVLSSLIEIYSSETVRIITQGFESIPWEAISPDKQVNIYRALQEILVNMKKHSGATLVLLEFRQEKKSLTIRYKDNGVGFPEEAPLRQGGLANTGNRIEALGGRITFETSVPQGVVILLTLPV
ncbi:MULTISPECIES: tetratricopeptide repeat-containing sensor histidine kinase [unclassified Robiginitalea]|uniref:tetratricopeptide repeat-containing sensor histidine kinase n=1 Tax=Robiginitalea TaxID=252306 RepID=UPI00234BD6E4|nr:MULTISPECIES: tetratricopeptide repeat protein [unclassified Robiginitalea]MDC6353285.1 tetratricopeptide repeat protein [Robiginitalea sp. PM2]MDC6373549.1 tetratricopeptide repeat protein [Robiginitalea sp. SP8]